MRQPRVRPGFLTRVLFSAETIQDSTCASRLSRGARSGYTEEERFRQNAEWEEKRFMTKPFMPDALLVRVRSLLDARAAVR